VKSHLALLGLFSGISFKYDKTLPERGCDRLDHLLIIKNRINDVNQDVQSDHGSVEFLSSSDNPANCDADLPFAANLDGSGDHACVL
jgi:hypothetical protein